MSDETKKCPYCREEIITDAIKCKHCGSMLPTPSTAPYDTLDSPLLGTPTAGERIFSGRYRIIKELGRGGMGVVYLAHDDELDMDVAVKFLPVEMANDRRALEQLRSEAKLSMSLAHDNIMRLHNLDTSGQFKFLVMEYVDGQSLLDVLREKERLPLEEALPIIKAICEGVDYAHSKRVLHRDLKPANIMLTSEGEVKITDFGIARRMRESMSKLSQKTISGTPAYMAPEHIMGEHITVRSDIYSLGAVAYELLAGNPPFYQGDIPSQIRFKEPSPIRGIPESVNKAILKALSKNANDRPASASQLYKSLTAPQIGTATTITPVEEPHKEHPKTFTNSIGMKFVLIPAGEFVMGSNGGDSGEKPPHRVKITKPFYLQTTEVTQAQWKTVMGYNPSYFKGDNLPVEDVSWNDAQEFLKKLSAKESVQYRLPTEAEWEYACRAGSTTRYCFGDDEGKLGNYAWYDENSGDKTRPVGSKKPNDWGLYDMHGNILEWCQDWYDKDYYSKSPIDDPRNLLKGKYRVWRGGCLYYGAVACRSAFRFGGEPSFRSYIVAGFRVSRSLK